MDHWVKPRTIKEQLQLITEKAQAGRDGDLNLWPPAGSGVYVVTEHGWAGDSTPPIIAGVLYVGKGNGIKGDQLRKRVGDLIIDLCGYFDEVTGHHTFPHKYRERYPSGDPMNLCLSWAESDCAACDENKLYDEFKNGLLNVKRPSKCKKHQR